MPWPKENFPGFERTASNYMRLARNQQAVADLPSVREAIGALTAPSENGADAPGTQETADPEHPVIEAALANCKHLTTARWEEFRSQCGEGYLIETILIYTYGRRVHANPRNLRQGNGREYVREIARNGGRSNAAWASRVLAGERPRDDFFKTKRQEVTAENLQAACREYDRFKWKLGDWVVGIGEDAAKELELLTELCDVVHRNREAAP